MRRSRLGQAAWRCLGVAVLAIAAMALAVQPGEAQPRTSGAAVAGDKTDERKAIAVRKGPLLAVVSIARQRIQVYDDSGSVVAQAPVSSGMEGHRTPTGVFSILQRSRFHRSNIYSNAPMPYMQRLTWSGIALHAGVLPGHPASHGCIRLPYPFAAELWSMTRLGTRVVVAPDDAAPVEIEHPRLPAPSLTPGSPAGEPGPEAAVSPYGSAATPAGGVKVADAQGRLGAIPTPPVDPYRRALAQKAKATADAAAATKAARRAVEAAAAAAAEARDAAAALRKAELVLADARRQHERAERSAGSAAPGSAVAERAGAALAVAEEALDEAQRVADEAWLVDGAATQEAFEASVAATETQDASREAAAAVKLAERTLEPISIFVSRKAGRVYIRQAWAPVHEAPVTFRDGDPPLGTHLYLAVNPDGGPMRWLAVSLPASRQLRHQAEKAVPASGQPRETAASALDRFEFPAETRRFIEERLWAGASLIVSDHPGSETGVHTDFIVLTR